MDSNDPVVGGADAYLDALTKYLGIENGESGTLARDMPPPGLEDTEIDGASELDIAAFAFVYNMLVFDHLSILDSSTGQPTLGGFNFKLPSIKNPFKKNQATEEQPTVRPEYIKLISSSMQMVNTYIAALYKPKAKSAYQKIKSLMPSKSTVTVIVPQTTARRSRVVFAHKISKESDTVYRKWEADTVLSHIIDVVLKLNPKPLANQPEQAEQAEQATQTPPPEEAQPEEAQHGGLGFGASFDSYKDLVTAANRYVKVSSKPIIPVSSADVKDNAEVIAVSVFTVFHHLCMRGVVNMAADAKYMERMFNRLYDATGCVVFASEVKPERGYSYNDVNKVYFTVAKEKRKLIDDTKAGLLYNNANLKRLPMTDAVGMAEAWLRN